MSYRPLLPFESRIVFLSRFPGPPEFGGAAVLVYDRKLSRCVPGFEAWSRGFKRRYPVRAGEGLKQLRAFPAHIERLLKISADLPPGQLTLVAVGGGSVGDFAGFAASVLKRGVRLVHIPSTWLAALDSAHGGKTALNAGGAKNPVGTYYPALEILLVKPLLASQPEERVREAFGELSKIALIDGGAWFRRLLHSRFRGEALLWNSLPDAVAAKYRIVRRDPYERQGVRRALNFGHTLGHVLEAHHGIAHGRAVGQGLLFSLEWGARLGLMKESERAKLGSWLREKFGLTNEARDFRPIPAARLLGLLKQDKKKDRAEGVQFVFLERPGKALLREVSWKDFLTEARRQGWAR